MQHSQRTPDEPLKTVTVTRLDKDNIEFAYKETAKDNTAFSIAIKISPSDLILMQKMLEVSGKRNEGVVCGAVHAWVAPSGGVAGPGVEFQS